ncbi:MAG: thymidine phosphorylase [Candidatus Caenarcaniphilales bacterium]|nr:thymidine phosphorylase [Candidatus Caenarcaniphilales bacterium]
MMESSYNIIDLIDKKIKGLAYSNDEINWVINNIDTIPDFQLSAWVTAVFIKGLDKKETAELTRAMAYSGHVLTLKRHDDEFNPGNPEALISNRGFVDKHSTGGVGDKVSLVLSPVLAALGFKVSKFSGGSLGYTGGTADKLNSIPGFSLDLDIKRFEAQIKDVGIALASQTEDYAPADKKIYALRDKTATVESVPLIASSVMSKKIAAGADTILIDLKCGSGAFMKDKSSAKALKKEILSIGSELKLDVRVLISNMDQPLGYAVGNALEVQEAIEILDGKLKNDTYDLVLELASQLVPKSEVIDSIESGKAAVKFDEWISAQGGDLKKFTETYKEIPNLDFIATEDAYMKSISCEMIGNIANRLALKTDATKDYSAGVIFHKKIGEPIKKGEKVFTVYASQEKENLENAMAQIVEAIYFSHSKTSLPKLIFK